VARFRKGDCSETYVIDSPLTISELHDVMLTQTGKGAKYVTRPHTDKHGNKISDICLQGGMQTKWDNKEIR